MNVIAALALLLAAQGDGLRPEITARIDALLTCATTTLPDVELRPVTAAFMGQSDMPAGVDPMAMAERVRVACRGSQTPPDRLATLAFIYRIATLTVTMQNERMALTEAQRARFMAAIAPIADELVIVDGGRPLRIDVTLDQIRRVRQAGAALPGVAAASDRALSIYLESLAGDRVLRAEMAALVNAVQAPAR